MKEDIEEIIEFLKQLLDKITTPKEEPNREDLQLFHTLRDQFAYFHKHNRDIGPKYSVVEKDDPYQDRIQQKYREATNNIRDLMSMFSNRSYASRTKNEAIVIGDINMMNWNALRLLNDAERFFYDVLERNID